MNWLEELEATGYLENLSNEEAGLYRDVQRRHQEFSEFATELARQRHALCGESRKAREMLIDSLVTLIVHEGEIRMAENKLQTHVICAC